MTPSPGLWRFVVAGLPAVDLEEPVVIGSSATARVRLPGAEAEHVRIEGGWWHAAARVELVGGEHPTGGAIGEGVELVVGGVRVRVAPSPPGAVPTPAVRTESLARELVRDLLGTRGAPTLVVEAGPAVGATRMLAPPESVLAIGRGDEATWVILDPDLSRTHAEVRRGWDETRVFDLGSTNGTRVDGVRVGADGASLVSGALLELGKVAIRYTDPAEGELRLSPASSTSLTSAELFPGDEPSPAPAPSSAPAPAPAPARSPSRSPSPAPRRESQLVFCLALAIAALASASLVYLLASS